MQNQKFASEFFIVYSHVLMLRRKNKLNGSCGRTANRRRINRFKRVAFMFPLARSLKLAAFPDHERVIFFGCGPEFPT